MLVYCSGQSTTAPYIANLWGGKGVVLGSLFESSHASSSGSFAPLKELGIQITDAIIASDGRSLIASHWGSYVLILRAHAGRGVIAFRGPMSTISCFVAKLQGVTALLSDADDYPTLSLGPVSINWDCIRAQSSGRDFLSEETGITQLTALSSGEALEITPDSHRRSLYWNPASITADRIDDPREAATALREATQRCIDASVAEQKTVLLRLSGGLDSSIVLACLRRTPAAPEIVAVNFWNRDSGDERIFAGSMTERTATELVILERDPNVDMRRILNCARTAIPVVHFSGYDTESRLLSLAHERKATSIVSGEFGDDLFGHARGPEILADALQSLGAGRQFFLAAMNYAELDRTSVWRAIHGAVRYRKWHQSISSWNLSRYRQFSGRDSRHSLATDALVAEGDPASCRFIHPWFRDVNRMPMNRTMMVYALITATSSLFESPFGGDDRRLFKHPLASQPLVETFCRIPSHFHYQGAENGAVARAAFRSDLSSEVMGRGTGKGSVELWLQDLIPRNRTFLYDLLMDGILVKEKILDPRKLQAVLSSSVTKSAVGVAELIVQCYIEAWLRKWTS